MKGVDVTSETRVTESVHEGRGGTLQFCSLLEEKNMYIKALWEKGLPPLNGRIS